MLLQDKFLNVLKNQRGYTLMEILVVTFVLGLVLSSLFGMLSWNFNASYNGAEKQREMENFRIFNNSLIEDLQMARDIKIINTTNQDTLQYVTIDNRATIMYFESDGLYKLVGTQKVKVASGKKYTAGLPAVYFEPTGLVRFNFYAEDINSLLSVSIKPIIFN